MSGSLAKNSLYSVAYKGLNVLFPLITSMYVARVLLADGVGMVASAQNIVLYFTVLAPLGIPTYGVKLIAKARASQDKLNHAFSELFLINLLSTVICSIAYYSIIFSVDAFSERLPLYSIVGSNIVFNVFNIDWLYQGLEKYRYITMRSAAIKIISLVALILLVRTREDYLIYAAISSFGLVANYLWNIFYARFCVSFTLQNLKLSKHIKPIFMLLAASIAIEIYTLLDTTMLTFIHGDVVVGYFTVASKTVKIVKNLIVSVCAVFLPRLSIYFEQGREKEFRVLANQGLGVLLVLSIPAAVGMIVISPNAIGVLFGPEFDEAILTLQILSISIVTVAFSNYLGYQILVTIEKENIVLMSTIFGAAVNIALNSVLIPLFKQNGAAIASAATEAMVLLVQVISVSNIALIKIEPRLLLKTTVAVFAMLCVMLACHVFLHTQIVCLLVECGLGFITYLAVSCAIKNESVITIGRSMLAIVCR